MRYLSDGLESSKLLSPTEYNFPWNYGKSIRSRFSVILHSEYPHTNKSAVRFDIVFLDNSSMKSNIEDWNRKKILIAIELKYTWGSFYNNVLDDRTRNGFLKDIRKLREAISSNRIDYGIAILLATEDISKEKLKEILEQIEEAKSDKIKTYIITPAGITTPLTTKSPELQRNNSGISLQK